MTIVNEFQLIVIRPVSKPASQVKATVSVKNQPAFLDT